jgi:putative ABC transport system permease protein
MIWRRRRALADLDEDIRDHLGRETEENIARGMPPDEAAAAARRAFGSVTRTKEDARAVWVPIWADQLLQDARYALRLVRRSPGFAALVVATLALGIGLTTAVFSVVNAVLLRPLAYRDGSRLIWIVTYDDRVAPIRSIEVVSAPDVLAFHDHASTLERVVAFYIGMERVTAKDGVVATRVATVSSDFWDLADATPELGRLPSPNEDAIVLSHAFFESAFNGDTTLVGRMVTVNDRQALLAGVLPRTFRPQLPEPAAVSQLSPGEVEAYHATTIRPPAPTDFGVRLFYVIARTRPGVTVAQVKSELEMLRADVQRAYPKLASAPRLRVTPFADVLVGRARRPLLILFGCVLLVLTIACVNIASLQLARASARRKEVAVRAAIGAGRGRVLRQFVVENLLLASAGGIVGLLVARAAVSSMLRLLPYAIPRLTETTIDARVLTFASIASVVTALACGIAPAAALWRMNVQDALKDGPRTTTAPPRALRARRALVTIELALASVLVVAAMLLVKSLWRITAYPAGFDPEHVLTLKVQMSGEAYRTPERKRAYLDEVLGQAGAVPGVLAAGVSSDADARIRLVRQDGPPMSILDRPIVRLNVSSGGYAAALGMRIVDGRWMTDDEPSAVYVVNEALARRYFPGENPIGRRLLLPNGPDPARAIPVPIVGIVGDLRTADLESAIEPELFLDYRHGNPFAMTVIVRTRGEPLHVAPTVRATLAAIDPTQALFQVKRLDSALIDSIAPRRMTLTLLAVFAGSALLLGVIGIYGVMAYSVAQRTQEIGVRMALGATRQAVLMMIMTQGIRLTAAGVAVGAVSAAGTSRVLTSLLYGIQPTDGGSFAVACVGVAATAIAACSLPAIAASLVDPIVALRCE